MEPECPGKPGDPGRTGSDERLFMETVLWNARTGAPWRDLPKKRGSRKFGPVVKVDRMMKVTIHNEETKESFCEVQSQGRDREMGELLQCRAPAFETRYLDAE